MVLQRHAVRVHCLPLRASCRINLKMESHPGTPAASLIRLLTLHTSHPTTRPFSRQEIPLNPLRHHLTQANGTTG